MTDKKTLSVELGDRSYPIYIGPGLLTHDDLIRPHLRSNQVLIVTNTTVGPLYLDQLTSALKSLEVDTLTLPDGEQHKNLETCNLIYDRLLEGRFSRKCTLIALGGGVIGDLTGFAAASYQRGVDFIQIPTTLLAQVDSSVGGKTGVNHRLGKNMIGAFHQPRCVISDTSTLNTLPAREVSAGLAEIIKYGLIRDGAFFAWLESNIAHLRTLEPSKLAYAILRSCEIKAEVVALDEREGGLRAILNLGHTFGHAIETAMGYGNWLHGEAVGAGMVMALRLSRDLGGIGDADYRRARKLILGAGLPTLPPSEIGTDRFMDLMAVDKKAEAGEIRLVLLRALGDAYTSAEFDPAAFSRTLTYFTNEAGRTAPPVS